MMPEAKYIHFSVALSSILALSGCSVFDFMKVDAVDDTVAYQKTADSVRALSIPPGLSNPNFDATYSSLGGGAASAATPASSAANQSQLAAVSTLDNAPAPTVSSNRGSSLGAALMAQSETGPASSAPAAVPQTAVQANTNIAQPFATRVTMPQVAMMRLKGGEPALAINAPYASAWKLLAPVLSDVGFNVGKQQPNQGIITTTYQGQGSANLQSGQTYLILLAENASKQSFIGVADASGKPSNEAIAQEVLGLVKAAFEK